MPALLIETGTERGLVAITDQDRVIVSTDLPFGLCNSKHLIPSIDASLKKAHFSFNDLDFIGVGIGPGSYTGIRIAGVVAKSLSYVTNLPIVSISTLKCFLAPMNGSFVVAIDARSHGVYSIKGQKSGNDITYLSCPKLVPNEALSVEWKQIDRVITPTKDPLLKKCHPELFNKFYETIPDPLHFSVMAYMEFNQGLGISKMNLPYLYLGKSPVANLNPHL